MNIYYYSVITATSAWSSVVVQQVYDYFLILPSNPVLSCDSQSKSFFHCVTHQLQFLSLS